MSLFYSAGQFGAAIPDEEDLHARYDFSEEDGSMPVSDQTGNGYDLDEGSYSGVGGSINGTQAGVFSTGDNIATSWTDLPQPNHIFVVARVTDPSPDGTLFDGKPNARHQLTARSSWQIYSGGGGSGVLEGSSTNTDNHIFNTLFDDPSATLDIDSTEDISGDSGGQDLGGFTLGADRSGLDGLAIEVGEILIYPENKESVEGDVEQYLSGKWGVTIS